MFPIDKSAQVQQALEALNRAPTEMENFFINALITSACSQNPFPSLLPIVNPTVTVAAHNHLQITMAVESKGSLITTSIPRQCARYGISNQLVLKTPWTKIAAGLPTSTNELPNPLRAGNGLYFLKQNRNLIAAMTTIVGRPWLVKTCVVNPNGLGAAYLTCLKNKELGLALVIDKSADLKQLNSGKTRGILAVIQEGFEEILAETCQQNKIKLEFLGTLIDKKHFVVRQGNKSLFSLPRAIFPEIDENPSLEFKKTYQAPPPAKVPVLDEPHNYEEILQRMMEFKQQDYHESVLYQQREFSLTSVAEGEKQFSLILMSGSQPHLCSLDPRMGGSGTVVMVARELVCRGVKPLGVVLVIHGNTWHEEKNQEQLMATVQGCKEACEALQLPILNVTITEGQMDRSFCEIGIVGTSLRTPTPCIFREPGDFISILGSHRGELGGSLYLRAIHGIQGGKVPSLDLPMERRLHEAILQGLQTGLLKSAVNVGSGGVALTLLSCLRRSPLGTGARIFLSRKLRNDELAFGETQGLVLITLGEDDLMEFERICMTVGVPSTTIGRVTSDGRLSFNDLFNVSVNNFHYKVN